MKIILDPPCGSLRDCFERELSTLIPELKSTFGKDVKVYVSWNGVVLEAVESFKYELISTNYKPF